MRKRAGSTAAYVSMTTRQGKEALAALEAAYAAVLAVTKLTRHDCTEDEAYDDMDAIRVQVKDLCEDLLEWNTSSVNC